MLNLALLALREARQVGASWVYGGLRQDRWVRVCVCGGGGLLVSHARRVLCVCVYVCVLSGRGEGGAWMFLGRCGGGRA